MATTTNKQRLDLIERYLRENRYADLHTLAGQFGISLSTVRRALNELEGQGLVRRHHGGASLVENDIEPGGYDFITQDDRQAEEKHAIAQAIAAEIEPNMTVILDGGTTTYAVARMLVGKRLVIITNSLPIAALFSEIGSSETIVTGGTVYARLGILYGPTCENALGQVHADLAVMGAAGMTGEGLWNTNTFIVSFQQRMRQAADRCIFALDHTKFGKRALHMTSPFGPGFCVAADRRPPAPIASAMEEAGTGLIVAGRRRAAG